MSETPVATATKTAVAKAAARQAAESAVDHVNAVLPTVVETAEVALQVPSKVVVNNKLVFTVGVVGGAAVGAGLLYGINKLRERRLAKKLKNADEEMAKAVTAGTTLNTKK